VVGSDAFEQKAEALRVHRLPQFLKVTGLKEGAFITPEAINRLVQSPAGLFKDCPKAAQKVVLINKVHQDQAAFIMALKRLINAPVVTVDWGIWP
jgi:probable selenium-dependent hydroxylase accessory protein YqeC